MTYDEDDEPLEDPGPCCPVHDTPSGCDDAYDRARDLRTEET